MGNYIRDKAMTDSYDSQRQAGALSQDEIVVTPQMIEAGIAAYSAWEESDNYSLDFLVSSIFRSMSAGT